MGLDMLFHVESLDEPPRKGRSIKICLGIYTSSFYLHVTVGALVRFFSGVDLPVPVESAWISQQFATLLTLDCSLAIGTNHISSSKTKIRQLSLGNVE